MSLVERVYVKSRQTCKRSVSLVRVYDEIDARAQFVALRVDPFFRRGLYAALIAEIRNVDNNYVVLREREIIPSAGSDSEAFTVDTAADIAPCALDKSVLYKLLTCFYNAEFCLFYVQNYHSLLNDRRGRCKRERKV